MISSLSFACAVLVVLLLLGGCERREVEDADPVRLTGTVFGTTWSVVFVPAAGFPAPGPEQLDGIIRSELDRVDYLMSRFREDGVLTRFNRADGSSPFLFDPESRRVITAALDLARETRGAFDPTVAPLVRLWGFGAGATDEEPSPEDLEEALARVGWQLLSWDDDGALVRAVPGVELDLSAIAKGHGVDQVILALSRLGPAGLMVEIGGDLRVTGARADRSPWRLGIQHPGGGLHSTVQMTTGALATSGDYRQRLGDGGERRTHIVDPRSGRPIGLQLASVSVIAPTAMEADAVATALAVMGVEEGIAFIEARPWLEAMMMIRGSSTDEVLEVRASRGWPGVAVPR